MVNPRSEYVHDRQMRHQELRAQPPSHQGYSHGPKGTERVEVRGRQRRKRHPLYVAGETAAPSQAQLILLPSHRDRHASLPHQPTPARRRQQQRAKERMQVRIWEAMVTGSFALLWTAVALTGVAKLRPVQQDTHQSLTTLTSEVQQLEARVNRARRKVELGLDPTQAETAIRESLNYVPFNQLGVVFEEPATLVE